MLELINIKKDYKLKDQEPVHALRGISLNFRSREFVAILGHSGCGKTTLLNIIGGLDHYDDGDLIIKGKSTKQFSDADWDTYRNHSIGFVFQSYNLIPHQSILKNVELALTISGISKEERNRRAKEALDKVGLEGLYKKKPNQLSGGQMQRVSIARALVNNPEIVLADEPTGALDSETSVQIMDLLKEVANNHLVIMVTHNPELADKYASRIVKMKDGLITADSNPYDGKEETIKEEKVEEVSKGKKKHSSMSFFTAFGLSLSNLFSKLRRTILVALAGSIGIIGVSTILGVSCGVNNFIDDMQNDMLSSYPISVAEESVDINSLITGLTSQDKKELEKFDLKTQVGMDSMIAYLLTKYTDYTNVKTNDITETFVQYINEMPSSYYSAINMNYSVDPTNNFFTEFKKSSESEKQIISVNGLTQQYIKTLMTVKGFSEYAQFVDLFTNFMKQLPAEKNYLSTQYELLGNSRYPTADNELLLVVDGDQTLTDLLLAQLGYYPQEEFLNVAKRAVKSNELRKEYEDPDSGMSKEEYERELAIIKATYPYNGKFNIDDILNHEFYYLPHNDLYTQGSTLVSHKQIKVDLKGQLADGTGDYYLSLDYNTESDSLSGKAFEIASGEAKTIWNTIRICGMALIFIIILAILISYLTVRRRNVLNATIDTLSMVPYVIPGAVVGISMILAFNNKYLPLVGTAAIMVIAMCVRRIPYTIRSSVAILSQIPMSIDEAAESLGAGKFKTLVKVTIPMMFNGIFAGAIMSWVTLITELSSSMLLYSFKTQTLNVAVYKAVANATDGRACALATVVSIFTVISLILFNRVSKEGEIMM